MSSVSELEKRVFRLQALVCVILLLLLAMLLSGFAQSAPEEIKAQRFTLVDKNGKTAASILERGSLGVAISVKGNGRDYSYLFDSLGCLSLRTTDVTQYAALCSNTLGASLSLDTGQESYIVLNSANSSMAYISINTRTGAHGEFSINPYPNLTLKDSQGFESRLGVSSTETTRTGESHKTSAASLVFFDKDGKVIEKFP